MADDEKEAQRHLADLIAPWESRFRSQVVRLRTAAGMTQTDLARALKNRYQLPFHQQTVQRIETGERPVRLNEAFAIADVLEVPVEAMLAVDASASATMLRFDVARLRRRSTALLNEVAYGDVTTEYFDALVSLATSLQPDLDSRPAPADLPKHVRWGLIFLLLGFDAWEKFRDTTAELSTLTTEPVYDSAVEDQIEEFDVWMRSWRARYGVVLDDAPRRYEDVDLGAHDVAALFEAGPES